MLQVERNSNEVIIDSRLRPWRATHGEYLLVFIAEKKLYGLSGVKLYRHLRILMSGHMPVCENVTSSTKPELQNRWGQLPLSVKAKLNQAVLTWEFPVLNMYLLV